MSDRHTLSIDYQIKQARVLKRLTAENSQLRAKVKTLEDKIKALESSQPQGK